ncbi:MAG: DUF6391 domain-containing protein [Chloroflexi bacterium]|nr:DUF6391 domain-containing protein [Chloroflexota bacterium]
MNTILTDIVRRTRQHHAIEHATIHMLAERFPRQPFSGISDPLGFTLYGNVTEESVRRAVGDALLRLQAGQSELAIHPNCGTNLATTGLLVTLVALLTNRSKRSLFEKFTTTLMLVLPTLILARPLGTYLQGYTTLADTGDRWVAEVRPVTMGHVKAHRVLFE